MINVIKQLTKKAFPMKNRTLFFITWLSYFLIIFSNDKWDLPMYMALPLSILGVVDIDSFSVDFVLLSVPLFGFIGVGIGLYYLIKKSMKNIYYDKLLLICLLSLLIPLFVFKTRDSFEFQLKHGIYLFVPEFIFYAGFLWLLKRILMKPKDKKE